MTGEKQHSHVAALWLVVSVLVLPRGGAFAFDINSRDDTPLRAAPAGLAVVNGQTRTIAVGDGKGVQLLRPRAGGFHAIGGHFTQTPVQEVAATRIGATDYLAFSVRGEKAVHIAPVTRRGTIGIGPVTQLPGRPRRIVGDGERGFIVVHSAGVDRLAPATAGAFRRQSLSEIPSAADAAVIDLDGDEHADIVLADEPLGEIVLLRGLADGTAEQTATLRTQRGPRRLLTADVDADGRLEIAVLGSVGLSLHKRSSSGTVEDEIRLLEESHLIDLAIGDLDADGTDDLIYTNRSRSIVSSLLGSTEGRLTTGPSFLTGRGPGRLLVVPLTSPTHEDIVVANTIGGSLTHVRHDRRGLAGVAAIASGIGKISAAVAADYDGDGNLDLALVSDDSGRLEIHLGQGNGHFRVLSSTPVAMTPRSIVAGDWDGDTRADLAIADFGNDRIAILQGNGRGGFAVPIHVAVGSGPTDLLHGDFGGPAGSDLAVANSISNSVSILHGDGSGHFRPGPSLSVGPRPAFLFSGDADGDGDLDLLTGNQQRETISILPRDATGFSEVHTKVLEDVPNPSAAVDLDRDGESELVVTDRAAGTVKILRGKKGGFKEIRKIDVGRDPTSVTLGDFDADGITDLAILHRSTGIVTIHFVSRHAGG